MGAVLDLVSFSSCAHRWFKHLLPCIEHSPLLCTMPCRCERHEVVQWLCLCVLCKRLAFTCRNLGATVAGGSHTRAEWLQAHGDRRIATTHAIDCNDIALPSLRERVPDWRAAARARKARRADLSPAFQRLYRGKAETQIGRRESRVSACSMLAQAGASVACDAEVRLSEALTSAGGSRPASAGRPTLPAARMRSMSERKMSVKSVQICAW